MGFNSAFKGLNSFTLFYRNWTRSLLLHPLYCSVCSYYSAARWVYLGRATAESTNIWRLYSHCTHTVLTRYSHGTHTVHQRHV